MVGELGDVMFFSWWFIGKFWGIALASRFGIDRWRLNDIDADWYWLAAAKCRGWDDWDDCETNYCRIFKIIPLLLSASKLMIHREIEGCTTASILGVGWHWLMLIDVDGWEYAFFSPSPKLGYSMIHHHPYYVIAIWGIYLIFRHTHIHKDWFMQHRWNIFIYVHMIYKRGHLQNDGSLNFLKFAKSRSQPIGPSVDPPKKGISAGNWCWRNREWFLSNELHIWGLWPFSRVIKLPIFSWSEDHFWKACP